MKLKIEKRAWQKIAAYVDNCQFEIGGLGKVVCDGNDFIVSDVHIFHQKVTPAHVDLTAETLAKFQSECVKRKESMKDFKFWWHSHAKLDAFFSGTDTATIDQSALDFPWMVSFVTNHAHKKVARLDVYQPVHLTCTLDIEVLDDVDQTIIDACKAEIAEKVTMPTVPSYTYPFQGYQSHHHYGGYFGRTLLDDDAPATVTTKKLTKTEKKRMKELEKDLERKERTLRHLEGQPTSGRVVSMINKLEEEIADISTELDYYQTPTATTHEE